MEKFNHCDKMRWKILFLQQQNENTNWKSNFVWNEPTQMGTKNQRETPFNFFPGFKSFTGRDKNELFLCQFHFFKFRFQRFSGHLFIKIVLSLKNCSVELFFFCLKKTNQNTKNSHSSILLCCTFYCNNNFININ